MFFCMRKIYREKNFQIFLFERPNCTREKHQAVANSQAVYKLNAFFRTTIDNFALFYKFQALYIYV